MVRTARIPAQTKVAFWEKELGYSHSVVAVGTAILIGVGFHFLIGYGNPAVMSVFLPAICALLGFALVLGRVARKNPVVHWLTGIPFAVTSTTAVGLLALVGGVLPESTIQGTLGAPSVWSSWPFLMAGLMMMLNLVGSVGKRSWPMTYANALYLCSHAGLAIAIAGGGLSALALERKMAVLYTGVPNQIATDSQSRESKLPFTMTLRKFEMESFPPTFAVVKLDPKAEKGMHISPGSVFLKKGAAEQIAGHRLEVLEYLPKAVLAGDTWRAVPWSSAAPAAKIQVTDAKGKKHTGWVSCGSVESSGALLSLGEEAAVVMPDLRPKRFLSKVEILADGKKELVEIEVNKKASVKGYDLYQLSYDDRLGAASPYSVIEAVQDRGIPYVYFGMILMSLGAILHLWNGVGTRK